jgi:hypothetical protein
MAYNVRVFAYSGIQQMPIVLPKQFSSDSVFQVIEPYLWGETVSVSAAAASTPASALVVDQQTRMVRIEVPDGQTIRYEINPPNRQGGPVVANIDSPSLSGKDYFYFQPGWTISMIDIVGLE